MIINSRTWEDSSLQRLWLTACLHATIPKLQLNTTPHPLGNRSLANELMVPINVLCYILLLFQWHWAFLSMYVCMYECLSVCMYVCTCGISGVSGVSWIILRSSMNAVRPSVTPPSARPQKPGITQSLFL